MTRIKDILHYLNKQNYNIEFIGEEEIEINSFTSIYNLRENSISWIKDIDNFDIATIHSVASKSLIVANSPNSKLTLNYNVLYCGNPKEVFFSILDHFWKKDEYPPIISSTAVVESRLLGENIHIGHHSYIGKEVIIGDNVVIKNNVSIEGRVKIGSNTIIHSGVVIGTDGYGLYKDDSGLNHKVPHYGGVSIGEHVEIGANTCIDRGTLDDTIIEDYVKIDNLCQIGHNVIIKKNACVVAETILCGSVYVSENTYLAPGSIIINQAKVGSNSMVGIGSVVIRDVPNDCTVFGFPARMTSKKDGA